MNNQTSIRKALTYLLAGQRPDGSFVSYSSPHKRSFKAAKQYHTTFFTSLILSAVASRNDQQASLIKQRAAGFLLEQKSAGWSFNYWSRQSPETKEQPYPDDLDDTFCALAALYKVQPGVFTGDVLAKIAQVLIAAETQVGGPYRTWLVDEQAPKQWQDIDVAVNANVAYFLSLQAIALPNVVKFVDQAIDIGLSSPYYPDHYPLLYFIGRWYQGDKLTLIVERLMSGRQQGFWRDPLTTALAVSTLLRFKVPPEHLEPAIIYLRSKQAANGCWPAAAFCLDPAVDSQTYYAGAAELTTALCIEALDLYDQAQTPAADPVPPAKRSKPEIYITVTRQASSIIAKLPQADLRHQTRRALDNIVRQDEDGQIVMLPWLIAKASGSALETTILQQLAAASLWGWMAYTIYDDFLDGEGDQKLLPSANFCLRQLTNLQRQTLPGHEAFQAEVQTIMDRLDGANTWEVSHCRGLLKDGRLYLKRLPDYGNLWQLADRSLGHTIAGLGVLYAAGHQADSLTMVSLRTFFQHYLIARQLNDDAHDWEEDLRAGHVNAAAVLLLKRWLNTGHRLHTGLDLEADLQQLKLYMWEKDIVEVCAMIRHHANLARQALTAPVVKLDASLLSTLIEPLEASAQTALDQRAQTRQFIAAMYMRKKQALE